MLNKYILIPIIIISLSLLFIPSDAFAAKGTAYVHAEYNNATNLKNAVVTQYNASNPSGNSITVNTTGITPYPAWTDTTKLFVNYTTKETLDNFVVFKNYNVNFTGTGTLVQLTNIYTLTCLNHNSRTSVELKFNGTDGHRVTYTVTPTCSASASDTISGTIKFNHSGVGGTQTFTSLMIGRILDANNYGYNAFSFKVNSVPVSTSFSNNKITSSSFTVGTSMQDITLPFTLQLGALPYTPTGLTVTTQTSQWLKLNWSAKGNYTGFMIERSTNNSTWGTINANTGTTILNYNDTGLPQASTFYYRVSAINTLGTSGSSNQPSGTTSIQRGTAYVHAEYHNGTNLTPANIIQYNSTFPNGNTQAVNGTGFASWVDQVNQLSNYTVKETTDNYVVQKDLNINFTGTGTRTDLTNIYTVNCPANGAANDIEFKFNGTNGHHVQYSVAPSCNIDDLVSGTIRWIADGKTGNSFSSTMLVKALNVTAFGHNAGYLKLNSTTLVSTSYSQPKITSSSFTVGAGTRTILYSFKVQLLQSPFIPENFTIVGESSNTINLSWDQRGNWTGFKVERSLNNIAWSTIVANTGTTATVFSNGGLLPSTLYYYRISGINSLGTSSPSQVVSDTTLSGNVKLYIHAEYNNGTNLFPANVIDYNATMPNGGTVSVNASGYTVPNFVTSRNALQNFTIKETTNNFVVFKIWNVNASGGGISLYKTNILTISCPNNGAGNDIQLEVNGTDGHRISSFTTPVCDTNDKLSWSVTWTGAGMSLNQFTSKLKGTILNQTQYGHDAVLFTISGIPQTNPTFSAGKLTSSSFTVGTGTQTVTYAFVLQLGANPYPITNLSGTPLNDTKINLQWNTRGSFTSFNLERSLNNATWVTIANPTVAFYNDTGLSQLTKYYYRVTTTNTLGASTTSSAIAVTTGSPPPVPPVEPLANSLIQASTNTCNQVKATQWTILTLLPLGIFFSVFVGLSTIWSGRE